MRKNSDSGRELREAVAEIPSERLAFIARRCFEMYLADGSSGRRHGRRAHLVAQLCLERLSKRTRHGKRQKL